jgi:hypothetical protein
MRNAQLDAIKEAFFKIPGAKVWYVISSLMQVLLTGRFST